MIIAGQKWKYQMQTEEKVDEISVGLENPCKSLKQYHYPQ